MDGIVTVQEFAEQMGMTVGEVEFLNNGVEEESFTEAEIMRGCQELEEFIMEGV